MTPQHQPSDAAIKVTVDGETYYLDLGRISLQQGIVIHGRMGMSIEALMARFSDLMGKEGDGERADERTDEEKQADEQELLKILHCFWWLMRAQAGIRELIAESDGPLFPFLGALLEGMAESGLTEQDDGTGTEAEPGPTSPSLPAGPPSPGPPTRTATTRKPRARQPAAATVPGTG